MANPDVTVTPPAGPVIPGGNVQFTWTAFDADTRTLTFAWSGHDDQGNVQSGTGTIAAQDHFTMDTFTLGGAALAIDNAARKATGVAPLA